MGRKKYPSASATLPLFFPFRAFALLSRKHQIFSSCASTESCIARSYSARDFLEASPELKVFATTSGGRFTIFTLKIPSSFQAFSISCFRFSTFFRAFVAAFLWRLAFFPVGRERARPSSRENRRHFFSIASKPQRWASLSA